MYEALFEISGGVAYEDATQGTDAKIELWCNDHCDLLHVGNDANEAVRGEIEAAVGVRDTITEGSEYVVVTDECLKPHTQDNVETHLAATECLLLPPLRYERGAKLCRVFALDPANLTAFYREINERYRVTVRSKRETTTIDREHPLLSLHSAIPTLSDRQREAIVAAHEAGYYAIPRGTTTTELGTELGIDRRTFEEHLRRAENKLLGALVERLYG
ncbi:helix-turn-helix domain-containing protein [Halococcus agarilyticus]|uniref:helix-turn-helix domain-containing protein n=1 Tax=Halococcus agarilyticus TaxID=1232219 RepID=UPI000677B9B9|nr:helix-turn-helix domain-containing protein [Halococcus agarilyticus]